MEAVARLEAGEALEAVLADFPAEERDELRELLTIVASTHHLQESAIPHPAPEKRASNKRAFLQAAAELKPTATNQATVSHPVANAVPTTGEHTTVRSATSAVATPTKAGQVETAKQPIHYAASAHAAPRTRVGPTWNERLRESWSAFLNSFTPVSVRLAPLAMMLLLLWLTSFGVVSAAQDSVPGDIVYPAKQWIREQALTLAAPEDKPRVNEKIEEDVAKETEKARARGTEATVNNTFVFHGYKDDYLHIGPFYVEADSLTIPGNIVPGTGVQVRLEYRLALEGEERTEDGIPIVQGISLRVVEDAEPIPPTPTPTFTPTVTPTATTAPTHTPTCSPWRPAGWAAYVVQPGDSLSQIAASSGSTLAELMQVNCITNANMIRSGGRLWVPRAPVVITPAPVTTTNTPLVLTLTNVSTAQPTDVLLTPTASAPITMTPSTLTPTTLTPTAVATTVEMTPTVSVSGTVVSTATPRPDGTSAVTVTATVVVTGTPAAPESTPVVTTTVPAVTPTPVAPTPTIGVTTTVEATAVAPVESTPDLELTAEASLTPEASQTVETLPAETPAAEQTPIAGTTTPTHPTTDATRAGTAVPVTATPVPEVTPANTSVTAPDEGASEPGDGDGPPPESDETNEEVEGASGGEDAPTDEGTADRGTAESGATATPVPPAVSPIAPTATAVSQTPTVVTLPPTATLVPQPTATPVVAPTATTPNGSGTSAGGSTGSSRAAPPTPTPTSASRSPLSGG